MSIISNYHRGLSKEETFFNNISFFFGKIISFLVISSILIAITGFSLPFFSFLLYDVNVDFRLLIASFFVTFAVYSLNKLTDVDEDSINLLDRAEFTGKNRQYIILSVIISSFAAIYLSSPYSIFTIFIILFPFCIGIVYSIRIAYFRLKDIIFMKSLSVALAWAVIGTFIPVAVHSSNKILISLIFLFFLLNYS